MALGKTKITDSTYEIKSKRIYLLEEENNGISH